MIGRLLRIRGVRAAALLGEAGATSRGGAMPESLLTLGEQLSRAVGGLATARDLEIRLLGGERLVVVPGNGVTAVVLLEAWRPAAEVRGEVHALLGEDA